MRRIALFLWVMIVAGSSSLWGAERLDAPAAKPTGSGVIVHSDGYILTAHHVVANAKRIFVVTAGEFRAPAILLSTDSEHDLALLKIETVGLTEAPIGYAGAVRLDQEIITVGFPFGLRDVSVTRGRIAAVRTKGERKSDGDDFLIESDCPRIADGRFRQSHRFNLEQGEVMF